MDFRKGQVKEEIQVRVDHSQDSVPKNQMHEEKDDPDDYSPERREVETANHQNDDDHIRQ